MILFVGVVRSLKRKEAVDVASRSSGGYVVEGGNLSTTFLGTKVKLREQSLEFELNVAM